VITAIRFESHAVQAPDAATDIAGMADSAGVGQRLAEQLQAPDLRAVILFSQGVAVNGSELISRRGVGAGQADSVDRRSGGRQRRIHRTWTLLDDAVSEK
jgi:hypothetical protein